MVGHLISEFHFDSIYHELVVIVLSIFFILITIVFWHLDKRNRDLIHNAEAYFVHYEKSFNDPKRTANKNPFVKEGVNAAMIFTKERNDANGTKNFCGHTCWFERIFMLGFFLAFVFIVFATCSLCHHKDDVSHQIEIVNLEKDK